MTEAPQQLHLWKKHFDKWAAQSMAKVLQEEDAQAAKSAFDDFVSQLEDSSSEALDALIGAFDKAVTENRDLIPDSIEPQLDGSTIFDSITEKFQDKI